MTEILVVFISFVIFFGIISVVFNNVILVRKYIVTPERKVCSKRIVYLADLFLNNHNLRINSVVDKVTKLSPDIIIVSGNNIENKTLSESALERLSRLAPVYCLFADEKISENAIYINDGDIKILDDVAIMSVGCDNADIDKMTSFSKLDEIKVAVCKLPYLYNVKGLKGTDVVFSFYGGGIMLSIPFYGVVYTSKEGLFPSYSAKKYTFNGNRFLITTGVGKSFLPLRISNMREIIYVDIKN